MAKQSSDNDQMLEYAKNLVRERGVRSLQAIRKLLKKTFGRTLTEARLMEEIPELGGRVTAEPIDKTAAEEVSSAVKPKPPSSAEPSMGKPPVRRLRHRANSSPCKPRPIRRRLPTTPSFLIATEEGGLMEEVKGKRQLEARLGKLAGQGVPLQKIRIWKEINPRVLLSAELK